MRILPTGQDDSMPQRWLGYLCIGLGILLILASFNSSWGTAYGQTVPIRTPTRPEGNPQIIKSAPECCEPGYFFGFTIIVTNIGTVDATNVVVTDTLPPELQLEDVTSDKGFVSMDPSINTFWVDIGTVAPGEIVTITVTFTVKEGIPDGTIVFNTAYLRSDQGDREGSDDLVIRERGACEPPRDWPRAGGSTAEAEGGLSPWLLAPGLLLLLIGIILTVRSRKRSPAEES